MPDVEATVATFTLSPRQAEVLRLASRGYERREIAEAMGVGEATVKEHIRRLLAKTGHDSLRRLLLTARGPIELDVPTAADGELATLRKERDEAIAAARRAERLLRDALDGRGRRCTDCGAAGHTRATCPLPRHAGITVARRGGRGGAGRGWRGTEATMTKAQIDGSDELGWLADMAADGDLSDLCPKACARAHGRLLCERAEAERLRASQGERQEEIAGLAEHTKVLRESMRRLLRHLETEARNGDGIHEDAWDDYHAARMYVGEARGNWDAEAAGRGHDDIRRSALGVDDERDG